MPRRQYQSLDLPTKWAPVEEHATKFCLLVKSIQTEAETSL